MNQFAKTFDVDGHQVLFYLEPDEDGMSLHQTVYLDGFFADIKAGFEDNEDGEAKDRALKAFESIDEAHAAGVLEHVRRLLA